MDGEKITAVAVMFSVQYGGPIVDYFVTRQECVRGFCSKGAP